MEITCYLQNC